jgi:predicted PurR-regulated permease PerM
LLIFLTFVFGFLQSHTVNRLERWIPSRTLRAWIVGLALLGALTGAGIFLGPRLSVQTRIFVANSSSYVAVVDAQLFKLAEAVPFISEAVPQLVQSGESPTISLAQQFLGINGTESGPESSATIQNDSDDHDVPELLNNLMRLSGKIAAIVSAFLLSILFSFLIVLDLPNLTRSVCNLENSRLRFAYREVAPSLRVFATVLGQALEAQFRIAILNAILTALGLWFLGLEHYLAFLSAIVFLFSFVPVAGVFISSVPICLVALQQSGVETMFFAILMITIIHIIEAYILNPQIYGARLRINPVIVLVILTVGGKLFHFWGLVLGVPFCTWIFTHAIRNQSQKKV